MPLPLPNLDDRRWADLVEEAQALIPLYAPEWTDHNVSDPGITFTELFAWRAEMDIFELNQVPDQHRRKFLSLVGIAPEPPRAARATLRFVLKAGVSPVPVPAETEFEGNDPFGIPTRFRTLDSVLVLPVTVQTLKFSDSQGVHDLTKLWRQGQTIPVFGDDPQPGDAFYIGLEASLPPASCASFYLTFYGESAGDAAREQLLDQARHRRDCCHAPVSLLNCEQKPPPPPPPPVIPPHHCARVAWEYYTGTAGWRRLDPASDEVRDGTRSLTLNGSMKFTLPGPMAAQKLGDDPQDYFYLRCVFVRGAFDAAPELVDIAVNAVRAEQAVRPNQLIPVPHSTGTLLAEKLQPNGSGLPCQQFTTNSQPVLPSSFQLFTIENNILHAWQSRPDFDTSNGSDRHFVIDPVSGTIRFGNGDHGRVVPANALVAVVYLATRADAGNLGADSINKLADSAWNHNLLDGPGGPTFTAVQAGIAEIHNRPATGGAAAETLSQAEGRAVAVVNQTTRIVTTADCETLALNTPGTRIARVAAKPNFHPAFPCAKTPGMIAVVIVPFLPAADPVPSSGLLRAVGDYLQPQRILGTRIEVFGPGYVEVLVRAQVQAGSGRDTTALGQVIVATLNAFFHPLTGGPDGTGWPFGRDVYRSEVMQRIAQIAGVDHVVSLALLARGAPQPVCGNICLRTFELVAAGAHQIEVIS